MLRLNRTTEYGLMALRHMSRKRKEHPHEVTSAREIADFYKLPFEILAKTLQRLKENGLIQSAHGAKGGYVMLRPLEGVSLAEFLEMMEGAQGVVLCASKNSDEGHVPECEYTVRCEIKHVMNKINQRLVGFLSQIRLAEVADEFSTHEGYKV